MSGATLRTSDGPFSSGDRFCHDLGVRLIIDRPGEAVGELVVAERHLNALGVIHGGALFSLADATLARASYRPGEPAVVVSAGMQFLRGARLGDQLRAYATEEFRGRRLGSYRVEIRRTRDDQIVATAIGQSLRVEPVTAT